MTVKDYYLHSSFAKKTGFVGKVAILKTDISGFFEHEIGPCTEIQRLRGGSVLISMGYDDVAEALRDQFC